MKSYPTYVHTPTCLTAQNLFLRTRLNIRQSAAENDVMVRVWSPTHIHYIYVKSTTQILHPPTSDVLTYDFRCVTPATNDRLLHHKGIERLRMRTKTRDGVQNVLRGFETRLWDSNLSHFFLRCYPSSSGSGSNSSITGGVIGVIAVECEHIFDPGGGEK